MSEHKQTALVTGASAGLGAEFCRQLAARCEVVIAVARGDKPLAALARELAGEVEVHCVAADLTRTEGVARVMEALRQKGPADILVNNAGFSTWGDFERMAVNRQRDMLTLHADAAMTLCRAAVPFMRELGGGAIINVCSLGALVPGRGYAVYGASKAFLSHFSLALHEELSDSGIRVQALCPGFIRTGFHDAMEQQGFERESIPAALWMEPAEVVEASLQALPAGPVLVVPGADNRALARAALESQLGALRD